MRAPKRPSVFLQRNTKFQNCTQTVLRFSSGKCNILKTVPKRPSVFSQQNTKFWKLHPNSHSFFYNEMQNSESCTQTAIHDSLKEIRNVTIYHQFSFVSQKQKKNQKYDFEISWFVFLQWKTKSETLLNFELHIIHKEGYKNIDYRKLLTSIYNGFLKPVVYCKKNRCKKVSPH